MKIFFKHIKLAICGLLFLSACNLLDIDPKHVVPAEKAFADVESYQMALNNVYLKLTSSVMNMQTTDYATDDFSNVLPGYAPTNFYIHNWDYQSQPQPYIWNYQYQMVASENIVIDNYTVVPAKSEAEQQQIDQIYAQALGLRAWAFFNIAQVYAAHFDGNNGSEEGIPLKLSLALQYLPKSSLQEVYNQIFSDLEKAEQLFKESGYSPSSSRKNYQFGLNAVYALRARVALFANKMDVAREAAAHFINTPLLAKENYWMLWEDQFGSANQEIIFMTHDLSDTDDAELIDYHEIYITNSVRLDDELVNSFSADDVRADAAYITSSKMPSKYTVEVNERNNVVDRNLHYKYFRLAEQYLIYAEAVLESDSGEALRVLNILRAKRGATELTSAPTRAEILKERRRELFTEGLRFYDLKRLSSELNIVVERADGKVLAPNSPLYNWDIPKEETNSNPYIN